MSLARCVKIPALLALSLAAARAEAGFALNITPANNGTLNFGYVLVGDTGSQSITVKNSSTTASESVTFSPLTTSGTPFAGGSTTATTIAKSPSTTKLNSASATYTYKPTQRGSNSNTVKVTGAQSGASASATINLKGQGVAPVEQVTEKDAGLTRIGTTNTSGNVTIKNVGDGNLAGSGSHYNLNGSVGALSAGPFSATTPSFSLSNNGNLVLSYSYTPTGHSKDSTPLTISFSDGSSDGKNAAQKVMLTLAGQGVGPTYQSSIAPGSLTDFGIVHNGHTAVETLGITNTSTDPNGGNTALTNLTLVSYKITGPNASLFSLSGFKAGTTVAEGKTQNLGIDFLAKGPDGHKYATLTLVTDQGAAYGKAGQSFSYDLTATVAPEPSSIALVASAACALLGYRRLRRWGAGQQAHV